MGLDTVELVMEIEDRFKITIDDRDAEKIQTVGQCYEYILDRIENAEVVECPSALTFYRMRRAFMRHLGVHRARITPNASTAKLVPFVGRRRIWKKLAESLDMRLPDLKRPQLLVVIYQMALFVGVAIVASPWSVLNRDERIVWGTAVGLTAMGVWWITTPLAICIPHTTLGDLTIAVATINQDKLRAANAPRFDYGETWDMLVALICEQLAVRREEVTYDASFVNDLGAD